jgi:hypothetical protein
MRTVGGEGAAVMIELSELQEVQSRELSRRWSVNVKSREGTQEAQVFLSHRELNSTPGGNKPLGRAFSEDEIREAVRLAIKRRLSSGGTLATEVAVSCFDLYRAAGEVC